MAIETKSRYLDCRDWLSASVEIKSLDRDTIKTNRDPQGLRIVIWSKSICLKNLLHSKIKKIKFGHFRKNIYIYIYTSWAPRRCPGLFHNLRTLRALGWGEPPTNKIFIYKPTPRSNFCLLAPAQFSKHTPPFGRVDPAGPRFG
jgi:hypothetical protein